MPIFEDNSTVYNGTDSGLWSIEHFYMLMNNSGKAILIPLGMLINEMKEGNELLELLSSFSCEKDEDIEYFLHNRAIEFEKLSKTRTYLVFDQKQLENKEKQLTIYGYISIALKILSVPQK